MIAKATLNALKVRTKRLVASLKQGERRSEAIRKQLGKLLLQVRELLGVKSANGKLVRGKHGGTFSTFLKSVGLSFCMAYSYMSLAGGKIGQHLISNYQSQPSRRRITYWQDFARNVEQADDRGKKDLLRSAIGWLCEQYAITAKVVVK